MDAWQQILHRIESEVTRESYENWLEPIRFSHIDSEKKMHLLAPNESARKWLEQEYRERILTTARSLAMVVDTVDFRAETPQPRPVLSKERSSLQTRFNFNSADSLFNPKYTFDSFVVGSCNEFAHAASQAVAANPARAYNPLYIYGGVGMGKTHLMHAIGVQLRRSFSKFRVVYVSSEQFMNEMVSSMRFNNMNSFHERFRSADALLVDDIQTLSIKFR